MEKFGGSLNNFSKSEKQNILEMKISEIKKPQAPRPPRNVSLIR